MASTSSTCQPIFISDTGPLRDRPARVSLHGVVVDINGGFDCDDDTTLVEAFERYQWRIRSKRPIVYTIDDGTGQTSVFHFSKETSLTAQKMSELEALKETSNLRSVVDKTIVAIKEEMGGFPIGTCLEVTGRLRTKKEDVVMMADTLKKFISPADEVERILLIRDLKNPNP